MASIEEARAQLQAQRQATARARQQLEATKQKIPSTTSQEALRKKYGGIRGLRQRQMIKKVGKAVGKNIQTLESYGKDLGTYEQEINQYEQAVQEAQSLTQQHQDAYEVARKYYLKNIPENDASGLVREYLHEMYSEKDAAQSLQNALDQINAGVPSSEIISPTYLQTLTKAGTIKEIPTINTSQLDRTTSTQLNNLTSDIKKSNIFNQEMFPLVGASDYDTPPVNVSGITGESTPTIRTTGSPIKIKDLFFAGAGADSTTYIPSLNVTEISAAPYQQYGSISTAPTSKLYMGELKLTPPPVKEIIRTIGEKIPFIKDVIASKNIIDEKASKYSQLTSNLDSLTQEQFAERIKELQRIGAGVKETTNEKGETIIQFTEPTVRIGASKATSREVPVSQLSDQGIVRYATGLFTGEVGKQYEVIATDIGIKGYSVTTPETTIVRSDWYGTGSYNPLSGDFDPRKTEVTLPEETKTYFTPEQIGRGIEMFSEGVTFPVSYGGGFAESAFVGDEFGAAKNPLEYVKKYPIETGIVVGGGLIGFGAKAIKWGRAPIIKRVPVVPKITKGKLYTVPRALQRKSYTNLRTGKRETKEIYTGIKGTGKSIQQEGSKAIIFKSRFSKKPMYEGIRSVDKKGYIKAKEYLERRGYTPKQIKDTLKLQRPVVVKSDFKGGMDVVTSEEGITYFLKGHEKIKTLEGTTKGVKWGQKETKNIFLPEMKAVPYKKGIKFAFETEKAYLGESGGIYTKVRQQGKLKEVFEGIGGSKRIENIEYLPKIISKDPLIVEQISGKMYKQVSLVKKTIPIKRKLYAGKTNVFIESGKPKVIIDDSTVIPRLGFTGGGKKSSKQFLDQLYKTEEGMASTIVSIKAKPVVPKTKPIPKTTPAPILDTVETTPSIFTGAGLYERTDDFAQIGQFTQTKIDVPVVTLFPITRFQQLPRTEQIQQPIILTKIKTEQIQQPIILTKIKTEQRPMTKLIQQSKTRQRLLLRQLQKQKQAPRTTQTLITTQTTKQKQPQIPIKQKIPFTFKLPTSIPSTIDKDVLKTALGKIKVFGRRYGKDILLEEVRTEAEAKRKLKSFLVGGLGASGFAERGGRKIKINLGKGFRPSKLEAKRVVQKKGYRFGSGKETKEAQSKRKKNKRTWRI